MVDVTTTSKSTTIDQWLASRKVKFTPPRLLQLDEIDEKASQANQARAEGIESVVVERYVQAMRNGDLFPPVVVYKRSGKFIIVDGNHRTSSSRRAGASKIWAYEIDNKTPSETIELLTAEANTKHGQPTTTEWRARQAVYLSTLGHAREVVASALGMSPSSISTALSVHRLDERAAAIGVGGWAHLKFSHKQRLARVKSDVVLREIVPMIVETNFAPGAAFSSFITELGKLGSEQEMLEFIASTRQARTFDQRQKGATGPQGRRIANPKMGVLTALGQVMAIDPTSLRRMFLTDEERKEVSRRFGDASLRLMECEDELRGDS
jgi:hypothetical protein